MLLERQCVEVLSKKKVFPKKKYLRKRQNEAAADKIRKYRADYNNIPPYVISFMPAIAITSGKYIVNLSDFYSYRFIGKLTAFLQLQEFSLRLLTVVSSTSAARLSLLSLLENTRLNYPLQG